MKIDTKKWVNFVPLIAIMGLCSIAFADDKSEQKAKDDREKEDIERSADEKASEQRAYMGVLMGGNISAASDGTISESAISPTVGATIGIDHSYSGNFE